MENNKVVVVTKAEPYQPEQFVDVFTTEKAAESWLRKNFSPCLEKDGTHSYYVKENGEITLYFIRSREVKGK